MLRVLENGEYMKVGSSKVQKTNVRIVAATNLNMPIAIEKGKFREDLFYRLSTVDIQLSPLRERKGDIHLLFRKFASDFAEKYRMPTIRLADDAIHLLEKYPFKGNIRQLRNITEQISVIEQDRQITGEILREYLPNNNSSLPSVINNQGGQNDFATERDIFYKIMLDMRGDINDLKKLTLDLMKNNGEVKGDNEYLIRKIYSDPEFKDSNNTTENRVEIISNQASVYNENNDKYENTQIVEPSISLQEKEEEMIKKSLERNKGKRKLAAKELGISERTLYRKIKQFDI